MGTTFAVLLEQLVQFRDELHNDHRAPAIRAEARLNYMESMLQAVLEKLRDLHDPK
jgi:hypothetical protein